MRDKVYQQAQPHIVDFAFNQAVVDVFPDMIRRSVVGYETIIPTTGLIAARHLRDDGLAFDLGCSLGATAVALLNQHNSPDIRVIGIDNSPAMIERATELNDDPRLTFRLDDIVNVDVSDASVTILNFVLQFLRPEERLGVLKQIRKQMAGDGLLIVSEKVHDSDPENDRFFDETHLAWKQANGYSELEISQKRSALENIMKIDSSDAHLQRFTAAGFSRVVPWYRCLNWASFLVYV
jgi:tRNA (cmo5U34)-methyltransferase